MDASSKPVKGVQTCVVITAAAMLMVLIASLMLAGAGAYLVLADPLVKADAVAVLSGGGTERIQTAADFFERNLADWFVFTETGLGIPNNQKTASDWNKINALKQGVPLEAILFTEGEASSTADEARALRAMAERRHWSAIIVVTDPYHTRRTRLIFRREFRASGVNVIVRPAAGSWYHASTWWLHPAGWRETGLEYAKLIYMYLGRESD
jgi:uncharacterized SAM-binding protein YcdF (DUF218 family)